MAAAVVAVSVEKKVGTFFLYADIYNVLFLSLPGVH